MCYQNEVSLNPQIRFLVFGQKVCSVALRRKTDTQRHKICKRWIYTSLLNKNASFCSIFTFIGVGVLTRELLKSGVSKVLAVQHGFMKDSIFDPLRIVSMIYLTITVIEFLQILEAFLSDFFVCFCHILISIIIIPFLYIFLSHQKNHSVMKCKTKSFIFMDFKGAFVCVFMLLISIIMCLFMFSSVTKHHSYMKCWLLANFSTILSMT